MSMTFRFKTIGDILRERGLISPEQLKEGLEQQKASGMPLGQVMINLGYISEEDLFRSLGLQAKMETIDLASISIPKEILDKVPGSIARLYNIVPVGFEGNVLSVATSDPFNFSILDDLRFMFNYTLKGKVATQSSIIEAIRKYYPTEAESVDEIFTEINENIPDIKDRNEHVENIEELASQLPIVKLINIILMQAINHQASDIHFEPFQDEFKIRYRLDGILYDVVTPPLALHLAITSRIKVIANLNIAETRLPQDGRTLVKIGNKSVDLRVSTLPTIFGESVVIRILDKSTIQLSLDEVGFGEEMLAKIKNLIKKPYGIILSTGPTGCGKTTTQYAALSTINRIEYKIITVEDPVEYDVAGLIQVSVRPKINLTFPVALRHILRQDPDIIMVGEIRDAETVQMAIHASLTGHLVFSTLHTNDAASAITRLMDMGVEPFLIASSLEAVLAQRLVRRLCPHCKEHYEPTVKELDDAGVSIDRAKGKDFYKAKGCDSCNNSGYRGRVGVFELLILDEEIRTMILDHAAVAKLRTQAIKNGLCTLKEDGIKKVFEGETTLEEIARITYGYI